MYITLMNTYGLTVTAKEDGRCQVEKGRLIVVHAGGIEGWVDGALSFKPQKKSIDYHDGMNTNHFME